MRPKGWLWTGLAVVLVIAGVLVYAAGRPPFGFLAEHSSLQLPSREREEFANRRIEVRPYTFRADWATISEQARVELTTAGFAAEGPKYEREVTYFYPNKATLSEPDGVGRFVMMVKDTRYRSKLGVLRTLMGGTGADRGWVTVVVAEQGEPSGWAKVQRWLGF